MSIIENYNKILKELRNLRPNNPPEIISVSKKQPFSKIEEAIQSGIQKFGENYIQEAFGNFAGKTSYIELHHIGPVQTNNLRKLFPLFAFTHGVGSEKVLIELNKQAEKRKSKIKYFLQTNLTGESTKSGFLKKDLTALLEKISLYESEYTEFIGLMAMGPTNEDPIETRRVFRELNFIRNDFTKNAKLSMGMSGDYLIAAEEGSDYIRIGSLLFGERIQ